MHIEIACRLGPGVYSVEYVGSFSDDAVERGASGPGWKRAYETKRMAKIPHLLYR